MPPSSRVVFDSDDSSASDGEGHPRGGDALAQEMAAAAERERRRNPHAESGRAKPPRSHPLAPAGNSVPYKTKKVDLFGSDSDDASEDGHDDVAAPAPVKKSKAQPAAPSVAATSASKTAHVQGLSLRAVRRKDEDESDGGGDEEGAGLHINKAYATRYEEQKRKQELHTLAEKYKGKLGKVAAALGDSDGEKNDNDTSDDDDAEEDDEAVLLTRQNSLSFAKALLAVRQATVPLRVLQGKKKDTATTPSEAEPLLLPKEELLKQRFFPPAGEQIRVNTDVFEKRVERKRGKSAAGKDKFTLSDEYRRALKATADSEDAVVVDGEGVEGERDGLRKLRPQNAEEAKLRAAFLRSVEDSTDAFEVTRGHTTNSHTGAAASEGDDDGDDEVDASAAAAEEKRLLEEAFALSISAAEAAAAKTTKRSKRGGQPADGEETAEPAAAAAADVTGNEAFLRDFFIQELWRPGASRKKNAAGKPAAGKKSAAGKDDDGDGDADEDADEDGGVGSYYDRLAQLAREEEDEAFFNDAEVWEREYQEKKYRHQEAEEEEASGGASASHVQTFPRPIGEAATGLLRKPDTARKDARQRRRERAEAARAQQVEELKRLKHLKRKEIEDQRALIASVAGLTARGGCGAFADSDAEEEAELARLKAVWSDKDLDAPFDPAEFDRTMAQLFNDDYYDEKNVDEDEIAYFDEELDKEEGGDADGADGSGEKDADIEAVRAGAAPALFAAESLEEARAMVPTASSKKGKKASPSEVLFDDAFGPSSRETDGSNALALLYPSEALQQIEKERQQLNDLIAAASSPSASPAQGETNAELLERLQAALKQKEEEYYQLHRTADASGGVAGGFRYREVAPEDFTLSIEEILVLDDRQLNVIAPMNCYAAYLDKDSNERDRRRIERRRQKGFRQVDSDRSSRRYGDVKSTALLNPDQIDDTEGEAIAAKLSKRLRDEGEDPDAPLEVPRRGDAPVGRGRGANPSKWPRAEGRGRGAGGDHRGRGRGNGVQTALRGRGGGFTSAPFRGGGAGRGRGGGGRDRGRGAR